MVNENIVTALHNAVEHGEPLDQAMNILINSGYNPQEVREASQFVGRGIIPMIEPKENEQLLPTQNIVPVTESVSSFFKKLNFFSTPTTQSSPTQNERQIIQQLPIQKTNSNEKPRNKYKFEIMLLVVLLFLIGILVTTIMFKDAILGFLSG